MTINAIYRLGIEKLNEAGIENSSLDARILICDTLKITPEKFIIDSTKTLSPDEIKKINDVIDKRSQKIPVAYLTGHKEFFGLDFIVDKNVLIPRPESEKLVELALDRIKNEELRIKDNNSMIHDSCFSILDLGTGSGNIIISIAKNLKDDIEAYFSASDISTKTLAIAKKNAALHHVDKKIKFINSDLLSHFLNQKFDLIIANLPYVPKTDSDNISVQFEPQNAIFAQDNGAEIIKQFLEQVPDHLNENGMILVELDPRNAEDILNFAKNIFPKQKIRLEKDLAGFLRYLLISRI